MKIQILLPFYDLKLTDNEKVFCYFMSQYFKRYGWDQVFTINNFDLKVLLNGHTKTKHTSQTFPEELSKVLRVGVLSETRTSIEFRKEYKKKLSNHINKPDSYWVNSGKFVEITSTNAILLYTYIMGALSNQQEWVYESDNPFGHDRWDKEYEDDPVWATYLSRRISPIEFTHILNYKGPLTEG